MTKFTFVLVVVLIVLGIVVLAMPGCPDVRINSITFRAGENTQGPYKDDWQELLAAEGLRVGERYKAGDGDRGKKILEAMYSDGGKYKGQYSAVISFEVRDLPKEKAIAAAVGSVGSEDEVPPWLAAADELKEIVYTIRETRLPRVDSQPPIRKPEPKDEAERRRFKQDAYESIQKLADAMYQPNAVHYDGEYFKAVNPSLRPGGQDEILRALYLMDLFRISSIARERGVEYGSESELINNALSSRVQAFKNLGNSPYYRGYSIWLELLMHHRVLYLDQASKMDEFEKLIQQVEAYHWPDRGSTFGDGYRMDGSVLTLALYALLSLGVESRSLEANVLRRSLDKTNSLLPILEKATLWVESNYNGFLVNTNPQLKYVANSNEDPHLVGGKAMYFLAKAFISVKKESNRPDQHRRYLDDCARVLDAARGDGKWNGVGTYYDFCYAIRACALAARYEIDLFDGSPQALVYLQWANELKDKFKTAKANPNLGAHHDASHYYLLLAHVSLAREFSFLSDSVKLVEPVGSRNEGE